MCGGGEILIKYWFTSEDFSSFRYSDCWSYWLSFKDKAALIRKKKGAADYLTMYLTRSLSLFNSLLQTENFSYDGHITTTLSQPFMWLFDGRKMSQGFFFFHCSLSIFVFDLTFVKLGQHNTSILERAAASPYHMRWGAAAAHRDVLSRMLGCDDSSGNSSNSITKNYRGISSALRRRLIKFKARTDSF